MLLFTGESRKVDTLGKNKTLGIEAKSKRNKRKLIAS